MLVTVMVLMGSCRWMLAGLSALRACATGFCITELGKVKLGRASAMCSVLKWLSAEVVLAGHALPFRVPKERNAGRGADAGVLMYKILCVVSPHPSGHRAPVRRRLALC